MTIMQEPDDELVPVHGLLMTKDAFETLVDQTGTLYHYEMINGIVYNMAPPSIEHDRIAANIRQSFQVQLGDGGPCRVIQEYRVAIPGEASVKPDVLVTCDRSDWSKKERVKKNHRIHSPLIVVEVLSPSTAAFDRAGKFARYQLCSTLQVYILVDQNKQHVEIHQRANNWEMELFTAGQTIQLDPLDLELAVDEIYQGVFEEDEEPGL